jgi:hypothetical protein
LRGDGEKEEERTMRTKNAKKPQVVTQDRVLAVGMGLIDESTLQRKITSEVACLAESALTALRNGESRRHKRLLRSARDRIDRLL